MNSETKSTPSTPTKEKAVTPNPKPDQEVVSTQGKEGGASNSSSRRRKKKSNKSKSFSIEKKIDFVINKGFQVTNIISIPGNPKPAYQDVGSVAIDAPIAVQNIINSVTELVMALNVENTDKVVKDSRKLQQSIDALVKMVPFISPNEEIKVLKSTTEYHSVREKGLKALGLWNYVPEVQEPADKAD